MAGFICPWPPGATSGAATATAAMTAPTSPGRRHFGGHLPEAALDRVERALRLDSRLRVAGVAGPGEPLANPATLETLRLIHARFPRLLLCLSTNGLVLSDALPELLDCGVSTLTVTVNTRSVVCAGHLPDGGRQRGCRSHGSLSLRSAGGRGQGRRSRTYGENQHRRHPRRRTGEIEGIACWAARAGAAVMNLMPLIPRPIFGAVSPQPGAPGGAARRARVHIPQFTHCRQCRADAVGVPGE
ncbi:MAG: nitrogen fixation protein NifB [Dysosmobacter welbionis]